MTPRPFPFARLRTALPGASEAVLLFAPLVVGGLIGSVFTAEAIPSWYRLLEKPAWNPPDWLFAPVWTTLYLLMGTAWVIVRRHARAGSREFADAVFSVQLALNLLWTVVFFGMRDIDGGLVTIVLLWLGIVATVVHFASVRRAAGALLVPYLAWVTIASLLNYEIWKLNT